MMMMMMVMMMTTTTTTTTTMMMVKAPTAMMMMTTTMTTMMMVIKKSATSVVPIRSLNFQIESSNYKANHVRLVKKYKKLGLTENLPLNSVNDYPIKLNNIVVVLMTITIHLMMMMMTTTMMISIHVQSVVLTWKFNFQIGLLE